MRIIYCDFVYRLEFDSGDLLAAAYVLIALLVSLLRTWMTAQ